MGITHGRFGSTSQHHKQVFLCTWSTPLATSSARPSNAMTMWHQNSYRTHETAFPSPSQLHAVVTSFPLPTCFFLSKPCKSNTTSFTPKPVTVALIKCCPATVPLLHYRKFLTAVLQIPSSQQYLTSQNIILGVCFPVGNYGDNL